MKIKTALRHLVLLIGSIIVLYLVHQVTLFLYFNGASLTVCQAFYGLLQSEEIYYRFLAFFNYLFKPILFYLFAWVLWVSFDESKKN